ncbi:MAG: sensor histidine kinase, partial [Candidatus Thorarchaeota archaeon]
ELRTPITSINLSINNLQKFRRNLTENQKEALIEMMAESSYVLNQMIEDLLIVSRIEEGRLQLQPEICKLRELLDKVIAQMKPRYSLKKISIRINCDSTIEIFGEPKRLIQVFRIIIDNAIKYSPTETRITVRGFKNYKGEYNLSDIDGCLVQISDEGIGIDRKDLPYIFDRFYRASEVKETRGTGLGLSIAKELVELHKGDIFVKSELNKGSTFSVFIPHQKSIINDKLSNLISKVIGSNG